MAGVQKILRKLDANEDVCSVALRNHPLEPSVPPGAAEVVQAR